MLCAILLFYFGEEQVERQEIRDKMNRYNFGEGK